MTWIKIAAKEKDIFWSPVFKESELEKAIEYLEKEWRPGFDLGLYMIDNESWEYCFVKIGKKGPPVEVGELVLEEKASFEDKQTWLKNMRTSLKESKE